MANSMVYVRENNLFEEAIERYRITTFRWKSAWWSVICDIYEQYKEWHEKYELNFIEKTVLERTKKLIKGIVNKVKVTFGKGTKQCYLFKFYDSNGNLLFSKIGTTERTIGVRLNEEINKYNKKFDVYGVIIESVIDCKDIPPEGAESQLRAHFIKKYPNSYMKNDRFREVDIPVDEFNEIVNSYLDAA